ncbi:Allantoate permease [Exophiala xenobiotica]|nr:Allantoate permease [Exophiala xenobiotica]
MADMHEDIKSESAPVQNLPGRRSVSPVDIHGEKRGSLSVTAAAQKILQHSNDADEAMKAFTSGEVVEIDEATNKRLLRTIDFHLMPLLCLVYGLNYLDKTTLSYASIMGIKTDINLKGDDYQWLSIFLGVLEAAVTPGFALITSQWYTRTEQGTRTGFWFSFNGFGQIFGGLVAYGIAVGARKHGTAIAPWKIVFLVNGCLTACLGVVFFFVMPDNQLNARWLKPRDRVLAVERVRVNQQGIGNKHFKMYQLKEALLDPLTWAFVFYALTADIPNGGISNFFSQLIVSFGYTAEESLLYGTPGGAVEVVSLMFCGWLGDRLGQRILVSMGGLTVALLGMILIVALPLNNNSGRLAGYYLTQASPTPFVALLSLISTNVAGYTRKTTVAALYLIGYCVGNIIGPQTFRPSDAPRYESAEITIIVCWGLCLIDLAFIWWYCKRQNKIKAKLRAEPGYTKLENQEWLDLTDKENPEFVYSL